MGSAASIEAPDRTGSIHLKSIIKVWLRDIHSVTGSSKEHSRPAITMDLSRLKFKHDDPTFIPDREERRTLTLPSHQVPISQFDTGESELSHQRMAVFSRSFHIKETLITDGENSCNVKVKLDDYMIFDEIFEEHFKCTGAHTAQSKEPITVRAVINGASYHQAANFTQEVHKYSGTWTVKSTLTGNIHVGALDQNNVAKSFLGNIQDILRYVSGMRMGYERLTELDRQTGVMKVISRGTYHGVTPKMIRHQQDYL